MKTYATIREMMDAVNNDETHLEIAVDNDSVTFYENEAEVGVVNLPDKQALYQALFPRANIYWV